MSWFKRLKDGVQTATAHKKEAPDGVWYKCKRSDGGRARVRVRAWVSCRRGG